MLEASLVFLGGLPRSIAAIDGAIKQIYAGQTITLVDPDVNPALYGQLNYTWYLNGAPQPDQSGEFSFTPSGPAGTTYAVSLTVSNSTGSFSTEPVTITVEAPPTPPSENVPTPGIPH